MRAHDKPRIDVVGLGPAGPELITTETRALLDQGGPTFLRTSRHPSAAGISGTASFDHHYEQAGMVEEVYLSIVDDLVAAAIAEGRVVYAVPGSPSVAERSVVLLSDHDAVRSGEVDLVVHPAVSFVDLAAARLARRPGEIRCPLGRRRDVRGGRGRRARAVAGRAMLVAGDPLGDQTRGRIPSRSAGHGAPPLGTGRRAHLGRPLGRARPECPTGPPHCTVDPGAGYSGCARVGRARRAGADLAPALSLGPRPDPRLARPTPARRDPRGARRDRRGRGPRRGRVRGLSR